MNSCIHIQWRSQSINGTLLFFFLNQSNPSIHTSNKAKTDSKFIRNISSMSVVFIRQQRPISAMVLLSYYVAKCDKSKLTRYTKLYSFRFDWRMVSFTAANTNLMFSVSKQINNTHKLLTKPIQCFNHIYAYIGSMPHHVLETIILAKKIYIVYFRR